MAGTDTSKLEGREPLEGPAIVLVGTQLGENIGATARAMLNCCLGDLRLVDPRDGWPNDGARAMASGASRVLDKARVYGTVEEAVADLHFVYATTARPRDMAKPVVSPEEAAAEMRQRAVLGQRSGVLFGRERIGLTNDEVVLADAVVTADLNPAFSSLNLAQAVLLMAWEWRRGVLDPEPEERPLAGGHEPATREQLLGFFEHLELALEAGGFFKTPELKPTMVRNLRNLFHRSGLLDQEVRTLHGVVAALTGMRKDQLPR